jgi:alkylhydroperoxidase/carboxymuconolactone decarboxylase family protein YurZ
MDDREAMLRRISMSDPRLLTGPAGSPAERDDGALDPRWQALVRLGALLATEPSAAALRQVVDECLARNITRDEVVLALVSLLPTIGLRQAATVAPRLGLAIGYDVEEALALR